MGFTVATVNVNGIRAAAKVRHENNQGILPWLAAHPADVVLMQEVRADEAQTAKAIAPALEEGWHLAQAPAAAKGRAGVAILSRLPLRDVQIGFGYEANPEHPGAEEAAREFDDSGRYIEATVDAEVGGTTQPITVASLYLPSGASGTAKQDEKFRFLDAFAPFMHQRAAAAEAGGQQMLIGGDWNICHRRADLKNWKPNRNKSGFLPAERAFLDHVLGTYPDGATQVGDAEDSGRAGNPAGAAEDFFGAVDYQPGELAQARIAAGAATQPGWHDAVRHLHPDEDGPYSWWSYRGKAFDTNAGWRIDLHAVTGGLLEHAAGARVDKAPTYDQRWSDHSPVILEFR